jgi:hypothetical protein
MEYYYVRDCRLIPGLTRPTTAFLTLCGGRPGFPLRVRKMLRYYWLVLHKAFHPSWAIADTLGTLLGLLVPPLVKLVPEGRRETMTDLVWEVPLSALLTLFVVRVVMAPWLMHKEQEAKLADTEKQLIDKANELAEHGRKLEAQCVAHQAELERVRMSDPKKNALRHDLERFVRQFEDVKSRASQGAILVKELYPLEIQVNDYLKAEFAAYKHFCADFPLEYAQRGPRETVLPTQAVPRCEARLKRLREALTLLS